MKTKLLFLTLIFLMLAFPASAQRGSIKLLAVAETNDGLEGSIARMDLEIQPGSGRVFFDTFPASKLDTQISTRFAKNIACKYLNIDCSDFDFYYTISADTSIVGGPSAGAAITLLTISLLSSIALDDSTAITGTINSGNLIGPVSGIKEKIEAASKDGVKKVLIPVGEGILEEGNQTEDIAEFGKNLSVEVIEVDDIDSALYEFTGENFSRDVGELKISPEYKSTMRMLADDLCSRSLEMRKEVTEFKVKDISLIDKDYVLIEEKAQNLTEKGMNMFDDEKYYSAASFCYGANVHFNLLLLKLENISKEDIIGRAKKLKKDIEEMSNNISRRKIETITDLQAYMIVKERLYDSEAAVESINASENNTGIDSLAYAYERLRSAESWSEFFGKPGKKFNIGERELRESCINKLSEAKEHYQYVQLSFPGLLEETQKQIKSAEDDYRNGDYALCLFKSSLSKAQINIVISSIGVKKDDIQSLVDRKLDAAKKAMIQQQEKNIFPIGGYSYYEYSNTLKDEDIYSSLLYSEYSLELSNLDIYFEPKKIEIKEGFGFLAATKIFLFGVFIGIAAALLSGAIKKRFIEPKKRKLNIRIKRK